MSNPLIANEASPFEFPEHFGFCGGVAAADKLVTDVALEAGQHGIPVVGLHEIVHNKTVVRKHEDEGVSFVDSVEEIPEGSAVIISAHGVGPEVMYAIQGKDTEIFDATCPLVYHTHKGVMEAREKDEKVIYVCHGKPGEVDKLHDEVSGMVGHLDFKITKEGDLVRAPVGRSYLELDEDLETAEGLLSDGEKYRVITQTTLNADECLDYREKVKQHILASQPNASIDWANKGDVCKAVANRQAGVEQLVELIPNPKRIVVVTDPGSKNGMGYFTMAKELVDAKDQDTEVVAVANGEEADLLDNVDGTTAITASASTPNETMTEVARALGYEGIVKSKDVSFNLHDGKPEDIQSRLAMFALSLDYKQRRAQPKWAN